MTVKVRGAAAGEQRLCTSFPSATLRSTETDQHDESANAPDKTVRCAHAVAANSGHGVRPRPIESEYCAWRNRKRASHYGIHFRQRQCLHACGRRPDMV